MARRPKSVFKIRLFIFSAFFCGLTTLFSVRTGRAAPSTRAQSEDSLLDSEGAETENTDESALDVEETKPEDESDLDESTEEEPPQTTKRPKFKPATTPRPTQDSKRIKAHDIAVEEVEDYDPNRHWLTGQFSFLRNQGTDGTFGYYAGAGARYGYTLFKDIFFFSREAQDSLTAEFGVFGVRLSNIQNEGDAYTVVPLIFTARYNIALSENWILFFYGGIVHNTVLNSANADSDFLSAIQSPPPALGVGLFLLIGPYWYARLDAGLDQIGLGLVLRF